MSNGVWSSPMPPMPMPPCAPKGEPAPPLLIMASKSGPDPRGPGMPPPPPPPKDPPPAIIPRGPAPALGPIIPPFAAPGMLPWRASSWPPLPVRSMLARAPPGELPKPGGAPPSPSPPFICACALKTPGGLPMPPPCMPPCMPPMNWPRAWGAPCIPPGPRPGPIPYCMPCMLPWEPTRGNPPPPGGAVW